MDRIGYTKHTTYYSPALGKEERGASNKFGSDPLLPVILCVRSNIIPSPSPPSQSLWCYKQRHFLDHAKEKKRKKAS